MKTFTYGLCFVFTLVTCGCASHRNDFQPTVSRAAAPSPDECTTTCAAPAEPPARVHRPLKDAGDRVLNAVACPVALTVIGFCLLFGIPYMSGC